VAASGTPVRRCSYSSLEAVKTWDRTPRSLYTLPPRSRRIFHCRPVLVEALDTYLRRRSTVPVLGFLPSYLDVSSGFVAHEICCPQLTAPDRYASHSHGIDELWSPTDPGHLHRCESKTICIHRRSSRVHRSDGSPRLLQRHDLRRSNTKRPLNRSQSRHRSRHRRWHHDSPPHSHSRSASPPPQTPRKHPNPTPASRRPAPLLNRHEHRRQ
jgi:hypothetical protein